MDFLEVTGGKPLEGEVSISGAKNATFPILSAALLTRGKMRFSNVPKILDVKVFLNILKQVGVGVEYEKNDVIVDTSREVNSYLGTDTKWNLRGTQTLLGAFLARNGETLMPPFGGCNIGTRSVNLHFKALQALGASLEFKGNALFGKVKSRLKGARVFLDSPSVGATENAILGAVLAEGETVIENAAREPEIRDLINFLCLAGASITVNGSGGVIKICGVKELKPVNYTIMPDRIEAATYLIMGAITRGHIFIKNSNPQDCDPVILKLIESGFDVKQEGRTIEIAARSRGKGVTIKTLPFPGFPTDAQSQMMALLSVAEGTSVIIETIFENRFRVAEELIKMGASIRTEGNTAIINGVGSLTAAEVSATDLRGGAALLLAALAAKGTSRILNPENIDRGYENYIDKVRKLGGIIERSSSA